MHMMLLFLAAAKLPMENQKQQTKGVKGGKESHDKTNPEGKLTGRACGVEGHQEDLILAKETGKGRYA